MLSEQDLKQYQKQYARLIVRVGLNPKKGSYVNIHPDSLSEPDFILMLVKECYDVGCRYVKVSWNDPKSNALSFLYMPKEELENIYDYQVEWFKFEAEELVNDIYVESIDPNWLCAVDSSKFLIADAARRKTRKKYRDMTRNKVPYVMCSIPSPEWAKSIFPKLSEKEAVNKLWETIFKCCHVDKKDGIKFWYKHCKEVNKHQEWLNSLHLKELHYKSKNGTDLVIGLAKHTHFAGPEDYDIYHKRIYYSNIPSEECFISPDTYKTEGIVYSSKPLCYDGAIIEDFSIRFHHGKAVEIHAKKNEHLLKELIETDENSGYLGEVALVPYSSPINKTGLIFQSILYDENAACHFALGDCYTYTHDNFQNMSELELKAVGFNFSSIHVDFMIGTKDLSIIGTTRDNKKVVIFKNGDFAK